MRRLYSALFTLMALAAVGLSAPSAATAEPYKWHDPYKWCAQYGGRMNARNCGFVTLEQCREAISGNGGVCEENLFYSGPEEPRVKRTRRHSGS
ncbi:MAG: DUF3551 domain-containing protein [Pseudolabrys sp.]